MTDKNMNNHGSAFAWLSHAHNSLQESDRAHRTAPAPAPAQLQEIDEDECRRRGLTPGPAYGVLVSVHDVKRMKTLYKFKENII
jgi:hypothetical protein